MNPDAHWSRILTNPVAALFVLAAFCLCLLASIREKSVTYDEISHATGGYTYWKFGDYRLHYENGNLPQRLFAIPLLGDRHPFPALSSPEWRAADTGELGDRWFHRMGNDVESMLFRGRVAASLTAVALAALVWACSRSLFGPVGGMLSLLLCVLNPTILANGALMTSDTAAAFFFLATLWAWWLFLHRVTPLRFILSTLATSGLFVTKMSAPLAVPIALVLTLARLLDGRPLPIKVLQEFIASRRRSQLLLFAGALAIQAFAVYGAIWGFYGFRYGLFADSTPARPDSSEVWSALTGNQSLPEAIERVPLGSMARQQARLLVDSRNVPYYGWNPVADQVLEELKRSVLTSEQGRKIDDLKLAGLRSPVIQVVSFLRHHELFPEAYLLGYLNVWRFSRFRPSFFNGTFSFYGSGWFFPYTLLVKTPLPLMGLALLAFGLALRNAWSGARSAVWKRVLAGCYTTLPLWLFAGCYLTVSIASHLNIGHRHLLPVYPGLFVLCGALVRNTGLAVVGGRTGKIVGFTTGFLLLAHFADTAKCFPHYLSYFNGLVSPREGYLHLVDSSVDWGQDLPGVRDYLASHPSDGPFYLSYFGTGDPGTYGIKAHLLPSVPGRFLARTPPLVWRELSSASDQNALDRLLKEFPGYEYIGNAQRDGNQQALLQKEPGAFRLTGGTYLFSATILQSQWNERTEEYYQNLRRAVEPVLNAEYESRRTALAGFDLAKWQEGLVNYEQLRRARLAAYLLRYRPDAYIGFSILVYRLSDREVTEALEGSMPLRTSVLLPRNPRHVEALCNLAHILQQAGRTGEAAARYELASRLRPESPEIRLAYAGALLALARQDEALTQLEAAVRLRPGFTPAQEALARLRASRSSGSGKP